MTAPNSTELQDRLTRLLEANEAARKAWAERDSLLATHGPGTDIVKAFHAALDASNAAGDAEKDMRDAIRAAATVLDHAHVCDKPTPADLLRENQKLRDQVETLGGNAKPDWVHHATHGPMNLTALCGLKLGQGDHHISVTDDHLRTLASYGTDTPACPECVAALTATDTAQAV